MNLQPLKHSEVSQKKKNKNFVLTHIYWMQKNGIDEPSREWTCGHRRVKVRVGWAETVALTYIHYHV